MLKVYKICILTALLISVGCQGTTFSDPPIHINPNMDTQPKFKAYRSNEFFKDNSSLRVPVEGTVARGTLIENSELQTGKDASGKFVTRLPVSVTMSLLKRGQERFNIFCAPCHGQVGDGKSVLLARGYPIPPTNLHEQRLLDIEDGHLFDVISNGIRNMKGYSLQLEVADRWAIVSYVRALQKSQNATLEDVPSENRADLKSDLL